MNSELNNIHVLLKEKIKRNTTLAARSLLNSLFTTKYIDPELYSSTLKLLIEYHITAKTGEKWYEIIRCGEYLNFDTSFNLMVCYHPIFSEKYYLAQIFLNKFKEELTQNDTLSLFSYSRRKLKKNLDRKYIDNINLEENIDTYLKTDVSIENRYSLNFFQRLWNYLDHNHDETIKQLCSKNYKNLIIAFTSENEWKNFNLDRKTKEFLRKLEIDKEKFGDSYFLWIIIIILPEKSHSVYIGEYYDFESSNSDSICLNGENIYDENSESDQSDESEFISKLKSEIKVNHPISIVHVKEKNESIRNAINFVTNFIQISKFKPLRMSFQNLLG